MSPAPAAGLVVAGGGAVLLNVGFELQHAALAGPGRLRPRLPAAISARAGSGRWLGGVGAGLAGWALYVLALRLAPLSLVQAASAGGIAVLALLAARSRQLSRSERLGVAAGSAGLGLLALSLAAPAPTAAGRSLPVGAWLAASAAAAAAVALLRRRLASGVAPALAAGVLYAAADVATRAAETVDPAFALAVVAASVPAFLALQAALRRGSLLATAGICGLVTNALPILAGGVLFGERLPGGPAGLARAAAFACVLAATVALAAGAAPGRPAAQSL